MTVHENQDWALDALGLTMKWIPPGTFMMGSTEAERDWAADPNGGKGEASWFTDERDPVEVRIENGFWMGQTTITRAMFRQFVEAENYRTEAERVGKAWTYNLEAGKWEETNGVSWRNPGFEQQANHPAVCVTWNDAMAFCDWLTRTQRAADGIPDGYEYRLPGEAEWEYAARGGRRERTWFWWGDNFADGRGRLNGAGADRFPNGSQWIRRYDWQDGFAFTSPVDHYGVRGRNGFGLADMAGNVREWCYDGFDGSGPHPTIWEGDTSWRVLRGGSFELPPGELRCAPRDWRPPSRPYATGGFRVVLAPVVVRR